LARIEMLLEKHLVPEMDATRLSDHPRATLGTSIAYKRLTACDGIDMEPR